MLTTRLLIPMLTDVAHSHAWQQETAAICRAVHAVTKGALRQMSSTRTPRLTAMASFSHPDVDSAPAMCTQQGSDRGLQEVHGSAAPGTLAVPTWRLTVSENAHTTRRMVRIDSIVAWRASGFVYSVTLAGASHCRCLSRVVHSSYVKIAMHFCSSAPDEAQVGVLHPVC